MKKQLTSVLIIVLLVCAQLCVLPVYAQTKAEKQAQRTEKITKLIRKLGSGKDARISVKMRDGRRIEGFIGETTVDTFFVKDLKTGNATEVAYKDVKQAKGQNLSTGAKIAIGVGIAAGVLIVLALIGLHYAD